MSGTTREITYKFSADAGNVKSVSERVHGYLKSARKAPGNEALEEVGKLARGAGAFIAVELIVKAIEGITKAMADLREVSRSHAASGYEIFDVIAKNVPVVGAMYTAFRELRGEIDGTNEYFEKTIKLGEQLKAFEDIRFGEKNKSEVAGKQGASLARSQTKVELSERLKGLRDAYAQIDFSVFTPRVQQFINDEYEQMGLRARQESADKLVKISRDEWDNRFKANEDGQQKINDARTSNAAQEQRILGQELRARLIEIKAAKEKEVLAIDSAKDARLKNELDPGTRSMIEDQAKEQTILANRKAELEKIAAIEADRLEKEQRRFDFAEKGIDFLKKQGELNMANGDASVAIEAQKLEIINEYAKKRADLENLLKRENIAPDERALLKGILGGLAGQQKQTLEQIGWGKQHFSGGLSPFEAMGHNTGVAGTARDQDPAYAVKASVDRQTPLIQSIVDIATKWFNMQQGATQSAPANFN